MTKKMELLQENDQSNLNTALQSINDNILTQNQNEGKLFFLFNLL